MHSPNLLLFITFLIITTGTNAQQYPFIHYTPKEGLVNNRARSIFQDSKGRLYICTFGGLSVYDGSRFTNYTTDNGLVTSLVNDIVELGDDSMLVIPNGPKLHKLVNGIISDIQLADSICPIVNQFLKCTDGYYYAISDEGLFRFTGTRLEKIRLKDQKGRENWTALTRAVEADKKLFIITDVTVPVFPGGGLLLVYDMVTKKTLVNEDEKNLFIAKSPQDEVLLATNSNGIKRIDKKSLLDEKIEFFSLSFPNLNTNSLVASYLYFDRQKNFWLTSATGIIKIDPSGSSRVFNTESGLLINVHNSVLQDKENLMWFTNEQYGLSKLVSQQLELFHSFKSNFNATNIFTTIHTDSVWMADAVKKKILLYYNGKTTEYALPSKFNQYFHILVADKVYLLTKNELYSADINEQTRRVQLKILYADSNPIGNASAVIDDYGNIIFTSEEIKIFRNNQVAKQPLGYLADQVGLSRQNTIWAATRARKLFKFMYDPTGSAHTLQLLSTYDTELPPGSPRSITVDTSGTVWIGTRDNGVYRLSFDGQKLTGWKQLTKTDGLSENFISYLHCDGKNNIWACSPAGLDRIQLRDGKYFIQNFTLSNFYQYVNIIQTDKQGIQWVLTRSGIIRIKPEKALPATYTPRIFFSKILVGNKAINPTQHSSFARDENDISFHVAAPTYIDEKQTRFSYWLEGSGNKEWSPSSTLSEINFVNLPKGEYTLHVKATFLHGEYPDQTGRFSFVVLPAWWQTWWFRIVAFLSLAGLTLVIFRTYLRGKLEKQRLQIEKLTAVEKERNRIAIDMHDDLGAGVTRIKFLSEMIGEKVQLSSNEDQLLERLKNSANELVEKMGEIIWAMNEKNNTLDDLVFYLRSYAVDYCLENNLTCNCEIPDKIPSRLVSGHTRRNVFLVLKESLHNIVKHAHARHVRITFHIEKSIILLIHDDGVGINVKKNAFSGNGLLNMEKRATAMNGTFQLFNQQGTLIQLEVPLQ